MREDSQRARRGGELVFGVLRMLMIGYQFWGPSSGFEVRHLPAFLRTTEARLRAALAYLTTEGLVCLDTAAGTVRLSDAGARDLLSSVNLVVFQPLKWH